MLLVSQSAQHDNLLDARESHCPSEVALEQLRLDGSCCCCLLEFSNSESDAKSGDVATRRSGTKRGTVTPLKQNSTGALIGLISCCQHTFHYNCIVAWSARENSCPQCKRRFTYVGGYSRKDGSRLLHKRIRRVDQKPVPPAPQPRRAVHQRRAAPEPQHFCFLCNDPAPTDNNFPQELWLHCVGDRGTCTTACHQRCLSLLGVSSIFISPRNVWFCPYCIRENRCVDSRRRRVVDCSVFLETFQLPPVSVLSSVSIASRDDILQPFLHFYRTLDAQVCRMRTRRRRPPTLVPRVRASALRQAPPRGTETIPDSEAPNSTAAAANTVTDEDQSLQTFWTSPVDNEIRSPSPPPLRGVPNDFSEYEQFERNVLGHRDYGKSVFASRAKDGGCMSGRDFLASLIYPTSSRNARPRSLLSEKHQLKPTTEQQNARFSSPARFERLPEMTAQLHFTKRSRTAESYASGSTDSCGSCVTSTTAPASSIALSPASSGQPSSPTSSIDRVFLHQGLLGKQSGDCSRAPCALSGLDGSPQRQQVKPTSSLVREPQLCAFQSTTKLFALFQVVIVKRYLKKYAQQRDVFKLVCRRAAEALVSQHQEKLQRLQHPSAISTYWSRNEKHIHDQVQRQWNLFLLQTPS